MPIDGLVTSAVTQTSLLSGVIARPLGAGTVLKIAAR
jgi:hypothetical protein